MILGLFILLLLYMAGAFATAAVIYKIAGRTTKAGFLAIFGGLVWPVTLIVSGFMGGLASLLEEF